MNNEILELSQEQVKDLKERLKSGPANLTEKERIQYKMQQAIDGIFHQVVNNNENFTFIFGLWLKETSLGPKYIAHVKEQAIRKINAYDKGCY